VASGGKIRAPFTDAQVSALNAYQRSGSFHPYTCAIDSTPLIATRHGWGCPNCSYTQDWAHAPDALDPEVRKVVEDTVENWRRDHGE
jgi:hypothetical protein